MAKLGYEGRSATEAGSGGTEPRPVWGGEASVPT